MNILVISENFSIGGLETHINTYYKSLKDKINFVYAFSKYQDKGYLEGTKIYTGLNLCFDITIKQFCDDVKKIIEIIKKEKINVIHVHPFYSSFAAIFAANITNTKLVYTYHGYGSINFPSNINDTILFMFAVESRFNKIFCVSSNVIEYFNSMYNHNAVFMPNIIYDDDFPIHEISSDKKWALISRLDNDKLPSIIKFLDILNDLDIDSVDIYGSGNQELELRNYIKKKKLDKKVILKGFINNLNKHLNNYTGVIGLGRVVQEALCMNYPTIFIGYGKVAGVIDKEIYDKVKKINFVPASLKDIDINLFKKQINNINKGNYKKYQLRKEVITDFGKSNSDKYIDELNSIDSNSIDIINKIYTDILDIKGDSDQFYNSNAVFNILYNRLSFYSKNIYLKNLLVSDMRYFELSNKIINIENRINTNIEKNLIEVNE